MNNVRQQANGFCMVHMHLLAGCMEGLGEAQAELALHLLSERKSSGIVLKTIDALTLETGLSKETIRSAINVLGKNGFLIRLGQGKLLLNPDVVWSGNWRNRKIAIRQWQKAVAVKDEDSVAVIEDDAAKTEVTFDKETGEVLEQFSANDNKRFLKLWPKRFESALCAFGRKRLAVCMFMMSRIDDDNMYVGTVPELAQKLKLNRKTVLSTMTMLQQRDVIRRKGQGCVMFNPSIVSNEIKCEHDELLLAYCSSAAYQRSAEATIAMCEMMNAKNQKLLGRNKKYISNIQYYKEIV